MGNQGTELVLRSPYRTEAGAAAQSIDPAGSAAACGNGRPRPEVECGMRDRRPSVVGSRKSEGELAMIKRRRMNCWASGGESWTKIGAANEVRCRLIEGLAI
jgi:hypothetical protein